MKDKFTFKFTPVLSFRLGKTNRINIQFERFEFYFNMVFDKWFIWNFLKLSANLAFEKTERTIWPKHYSSDETLPKYESATIAHYGIRASIDVFGFRTYLSLMPIRIITYFEPKA